MKIIVDLHETIEYFEKYAIIEQVYSEEEIPEYLAKAKELNGEHEILTLEEYINLIHEVEWVTEDSYLITDCGTTITEYY